MDYFHSKRSRDREGKTMTTDGSKVLGRGKGFVYVVGHDKDIKEMFYSKGFGITTIQKQADIICFKGGWDIDPFLYGQKKNKEANVSINFEDDRRDIAAWKMSEPRQIKVGICRGGQFLNVMNGGKLYQHVSGHASTHPVIDTLRGREIRVSSSHHQMMIPTDSGEVLAYSEGIGYSYMTEKGPMEGRPEIEPEVVWYQGTRSLCYQGHPEWNPPQEGQDYFFELLETVRG